MKEKIPVNLTLSLSIQKGDINWIFEILSKNKVNKLFKRKWANIKIDAFLDLVRRFLIEAYEYYVTYLVLGNPFHNWWKFINPGFWAKTLKVWKCEKLKVCKTLLDRFALQRKYLENHARSMKSNKSV